MFEAFRDELTIPKTQRPPVAPEPIVPPPSHTRREPVPSPYSDDPKDYQEIPLDEFDAYLQQAARAQPAASPAAPSSPAGAPETPAALSAGTPNLDVASLLALFGSLLAGDGLGSQMGAERPPEGTNSRCDFLSTSESSPSFTPELLVKTKPLSRLAKKTTELIGNQSPRRKMTAVGSVAVIAALAAFGLPSRSGPTKQESVQLAAPAGLINQGAVIGLVDQQSQATVHIPVPGFEKPLLFIKNNKPVEPAATLNDTISLTLAPKMDKNGNVLPIATVQNGATFEVDRTNIDVKATFDNYLGLNIDCIKQATAKYRYCVAGSPVKLQASGNLKATTANQLNNLLTAQGSNFDTFYQGVKAKLAVASLAKLEQGSCGTQIFSLADAVVQALLQKQSNKAQISFKPGSHYPSISTDYATNFTNLVGNPAFSIEQGDSKNAIANSLQVTCKVTPIKP
jgi:hypothetical protein